jgi:hypothetical protein
LTINLLKSARYNVFLILYVMIFAGLNSAVFAQTALVADDREAAIYTIYNIEIDETARNVILARQTALAKGQRMALDKLFRRIILSDDLVRLPDFTDSDLLEFVSGFEIKNERRSTVRYMASLIVYFNRDIVKEVLTTNGIPYAETLGISVSVLPVLEQAGALLLWEKENDWRKAWEDYDVINNLVPVNTPKASLMNRYYVSALQAKTAHKDSLKGFIQKNNLNDLIVAAATVKRDLLNNQLELIINLKRDTEENVEKEIIVTVPAVDEFGNENLPALYLKGVEEVTAWVDDLWKAKVLVQYGQTTKIMVTGPLAKLDDWLRIQKKLEQINLIRANILKKISVGKVILEIEFAGEPDQLKVSLAQQGLILKQDLKQQWILELNA